MMLELRRASYTYPDGTPGLRQVDLTVTRGERWGLIGPNGAGKTTLLHVADGLLRPQSGSVSALGQALDSETVINGVRRGVGLVFQNPDDQLFCPTVFDDVAFGPLHHDLPPAEAHERAHRALARVGLAGFENRVPQHLSGGEKRRVALATVLAMEPELILFDEPTSGLDPRGRLEAIDLLEGLGATLLIATHDFELILRSCDRVALLFEGRLAAAGSPGEILFDESLLERHGLAMPVWLPHARSLLANRRSGAGGPERLSAGPIAS